MTIKSKFVSLLGGALLVTTSIMPMFAGAETRDKMSSSTRPATGGGFCSALVERASFMQKQFSATKERLGGRKEDRKDNLEKRWNDYQGDLKNKQDKQDRELSGSIDKLNQRAATDTQKTAVAAFQQAMQAALSARKTAVAAALKAFHDGVAAALEAKKAGLANALKTATDAVNAALQKAQADCASGTANAKTIRTAFMNAVQSARSSFNSARKGDDMSGEMRKLTAAKKAALKKAQDDFHAAVTAARDALKVTFPKNATSTAPKATSTKKDND